MLLRKMPTSMSTVIAIIMKPDKDPSARGNSGLRKITECS